MFLIKIILRLIVLIMHILWFMSLLSVIIPILAYLLFGIRWFYLSYDIDSFSEDIDEL